MEQQQPRGQIQPYFTLLRIFNWWLLMYTSYCSYLVKQLMHATSSSEAAGDWKWAVGVLTWLQWPGWKGNTFFSSFAYSAPRYPIWDIELFWLLQLVLPLETKFSFIQPLMLGFVWGVIWDPTLLTSVYQVHSNICWWHLYFSLKSWHCIWELEKC